MCRQLQSLPAASLPAALPNGAANGSKGPDGPLFLPASEPLWALLEAAFTHFPRVVLAACIHALKLVDNSQLFAVASQFVSVRLLAPRPVRGAAAAADGSVDGAAGADPPGGSAAAAAAGGGDGGAQQSTGVSLFRQVMATEEREQRWFKQHVQQFLQGEQAP